MPTIPFDDFGLQIVRGVAGGFSGEFDYSPRHLCIDAIRVDVFGGPDRLETVPITHPMWQRFADELEIAYADQIAEELDDYRAAAKDTAGEKRFEDAYHES